jgi:preprotein translocase subunit YajC
VDFTPLIPVLLIAGAFYLLVLRPARARQRAAQVTAEQVAPGLRVMTTAGLFGTVAAVDGDQIDLEIAPGVTVRYMTAAVAKVLSTADDLPADSGTPEAVQPSFQLGDTPDA